MPPARARFRLRRHGYGAGGNTIGEAYATGAAGAAGVGTVAVVGKGLHAAAGKVADGLRPEPSKEAPPPDREP